MAIVEVKSNGAKPFTATIRRKVQIGTARFEDEAHMKSYSAVCVRGPMEKDEKLLIVSGICSSDNEEGGVYVAAVVGKDSEITLKDGAAPDLVSIMVHGGKSDPIGTVGPSWAIRAPDQMAENEGGHRAPIEKLREWLWGHVEEVEAWCAVNRASAMENGRKDRETRERWLFNVWATLHGITIACRFLEEGEPRNLPKEARVDMLRRMCDLEWLARNIRWPIQAGSHEIS